MKATIVLLANNEAENLGRKLMLQAHNIAGTGFQMARLPHHVSLKQPFEISDLSSIEKYFDDLSLSQAPLSLTLTKLGVIESNVFGLESGLIWLEVDENKELRGLHNRLNEDLESRFKNTRADFDGDSYKFHMTLALGNKPFSNYRKAYDLMEKDYYMTSIFDEIALFYYHGDSIEKDSYFCYKRKKLRGST